MIRSEYEVVKTSLYCFLQHLSEDKTVQDVLQNLFHHTKDLRSLHLLLVCIWVFLRRLLAVIHEQLSWFSGH